MTKNGLGQIDQLIQKRFEGNNRKLRQDLRKDIKTEVNPLHDRLDVQRDQINDVKKDLSIKIDGVKKDLSVKIDKVKEDLSAQINREAQDIVSILSDVVISKLEQHDEQIAELQEEAGLKPRKH